MIVTMDLKTIIEETLEEFCEEFIRYPYLCYTEHGLHALFYTRLYNKLPCVERFHCFNGQKICVIQKEYPTEGILGKPQRQHWDIAIIDPAMDAIDKNEWAGLQGENNPTYHAYDALKLFAVVEFGLNEGEEHLADDIKRLQAAEHIQHRYIVHLYRTSRSPLFSSRDISENNKKMMTSEHKKMTDTVQAIIDDANNNNNDKEITLFYRHAKG